MPIQRIRPRQGTRLAIDTCPGESAELIKDRLPMAAYMYSCRPKKRQTAFHNNRDKKRTDPSSPSLLAMFLVCQWHIFARLCAEPENIPVNVLKLHLIRPR